MKAPVLLSSEIIRDIPPENGNPRNSEGDFALLKDGRILFAYSRYHGGDCSDGAPCDIGGMISSDGGKTFEPLPYLLACASDHGVSNIMSVSLCRLKNGTLCLFFLAKYPPLSCMFLRRATGDETAFGPAEVCVPLEAEVYYVINNSRVCMLPDGRLILPMAVHKLAHCENGWSAGTYFGSAKMFVGDPDGKNWKLLSHEISMPYPGHSTTGLQEPGVEVLPDGRLYAYFRTDRGFHYESISSDGGASWTAPTQSPFTGPDSPLVIRRNPFDGWYYAVWNPIPKYNGRDLTSAGWGRTPLVLAVSRDGAEYSPCAVIEDRPDCGYCYPAIRFTGKNQMLLSYCAGGPEDGACLNRTRIRAIRVELPE